jgi:ADP-heptose:LPS heptosyltransferase
MRKILFVRLRSMGDAVLMTPALRALRRGLEDAEIHVALERPLSSLFEDHPDIDRIHVLDKGVLGKLVMALRLRREGFDAAINLHGGPTSAWMTRATGAKHRVGRDSYRLGYLYNVRVPPPEDVFADADSIHTVHTQASLVAALGIQVEDFSLHLEVSDTARTSTRRRLEELGVPHEGYVVLQPSASFLSKQWSLERFLELSGKIRKHSGREVIVSLPGSPRLGREGPSVLRRFILMGRFDDHVTSSSIADIRRVLAGELPVLSDLPLNQLAALMETASLYIGNDSGPMHIAAALGTPVVGIFGSSDPRRWHPWGAPHRTLWAGLECSPCHGKWCDNPERHACLARIQVDTVLEASLELLDDSR